MRRQDRLERELTAWFAEMRASRTPGLGDEVMRATTNVRQRPRWTFAERWVPAYVPVLADRWLSRRVRQIALLAILALPLAAAMAIAVGGRPAIPWPFARVENGVIAFAVDGDILVVDPLSGELTTLVGGPAVDRYPVFSPDGSRIAFERSVEGGTKPVAVTSSGDELVELLQDPVEAVRGLSWAPDGSLLAFANGDLWIVAADGSGGHRLDISFRAEFPQWRPPGGLELLFSNNAYPAHFLIRRDGAGVRPLTFSDGTFVDDTFPRWTPDGGSVVSFREERDAGPSGGWRIHVMTVLHDGRIGEDRVLGPPVLPTVGYHVSPDGARIAFASPDRGGTSWRIGSVPIDGSEPPIMTTREFTGPPPILGWSPDGTLIIISTAEPPETWLLDAHGAAARKAAWRDPSEEPPAWQAIP